MATASVRCVVDDDEEAISFYTRHLGFGVELHPAPGFASLSRGDLRLLLNAPGAGGLWGEGAWQSEGVTRRVALVNTLSRQGAR